LFLGYVGLDGGGEEGDSDAGDPHADESEDPWNLVDSQNNSYDLTHQWLRHHHVCHHNYGVAEESDSIGNEGAGPAEDPHYQGCVEDVLWLHPPKEPIDRVHVERRLVD